VLSGLSIRLSVEQRGLTAPGSVKVYLYKRARRIVPLYVLSLALAALVALTVAPVPAEAISLRTLVGNLLFLQTAVGVSGMWFFPYAGNGPLWSLSFEAFFYLAYPLLVRKVSGRTQRMVVVLGVTALGLGVGAVVPNPLAMFCAASLMWYLGVELAERHLGAHPSLPMLAFVAQWLLLTALRFSLVGLTVHGLWVATSLFLVAVTLFPRLPNVPDSYASMRRHVLVPLSRVGALSYGLYVLHVPILRAFAAVCGGGFISALCGVITCVCVAWLAERVAARVPL
jgi:peptidoglycan/LPS O-acetylase OafA/YrhL